jgi:hypothetical protein
MGHPPHQRRINETHVGRGRGVKCELQEEQVVRKFRTTAADGKKYLVAHYNLETEKVPDQLNNHPLFLLFLVEK